MGDHRSSNCRLAQVLHLGRIIAIELSGIYDSNRAAIKRKIIKGAVMLEREFKYYQNNRAELDNNYDGKFIVIVGEEVLGAFDTQEEAIRVAISQSHSPGTFLLQYCSPREDQTQHFRTRAIF